MASLKDLLRYNTEGGLIHPTEEGIQNFNKWFGSSKSVDEKGRPLVLYHTTKDDFDTFNKKKGGTYFTEDPSVSSAIFGHDYSGKTHEVYLNMQNPFDARWASMDDAKKEELRGIINSLVDEDEISDAAERLGVSVDDADPFDLFTSGEFYFGYGRNKQNEILDAIKNKGYDSVVYPDNLALGSDHVSHVVFEPNQIKSATENTGAFSPTDPSILRSHPVATALAGTGLAGLFASGQQPPNLREQANALLNKRYDPAGLEAMTGVAPPTRYGDILQTVAGLSDIYAPLAAAEAVDYARENDWKNAGLSALGAVPMFGGAVGRIKPKRGLAGMK